LGPKFCWWPKEADGCGWRREAKLTRNAHEKRGIYSNAEPRPARKQGSIYICFFASAFAFEVRSGVLCREGFAHPEVASGWLRATEMARIVSIKVRIAVL
jgi:hypothetical protein